MDTAVIPVPAPPILDTCPWCEGSLVVDLATDVLDCATCLTHLDLDPPAPSPTAPARERALAA
jgi:hypothetical protein